MSERPPRGNHSRAGSDYTCPQDYTAYSASRHDSYRRLYARQSDLLRCMTSRYKIDSYQPQYFLIDSFDTLRALTQPDFRPLYQALNDGPSQAT